MADLATWVRAWMPVSENRQMQEHLSSWEGVHFFRNTDDYDERVWPPEYEEGFCFCGNDLWMMSCGCPGANDIGWGD